MKAILQRAFDYFSGDISGQERTAHFLHQDKPQLPAFYFFVVSHELEIATRAEIGNRNRLPGAFQYGGDPTHIVSTQEAQPLGRARRDDHSGRDSFAV